MHPDAQRRRARTHARARAHRHTHVLSVARTATLADSDGARRDPDTPWRRHHGTHHKFLFECTLESLALRQVARAGCVAKTRHWHRSTLTRRRGSLAKQIPRTTLKINIPLCVRLNRVSPALLLRVSLVYPPRRTRPLRGTLCCSEDKHLLCLPLGWLRRRFGKPANNNNRKAQWCDADRPCRQHAHRILSERVRPGRARPDCSPVGRL